MPQFSKEEIMGLKRTFALYARFPEAEYPKITVAERFDEEGNRAFADLTEVYRKRYFQTAENP
jgi:hypothetical protein